MTRAVGRPYRSIVHLVREALLGGSTRFLDWLAALPPVPASTLVLMAPVRGRERVPAGARRRGGGARRVPRASAGAVSAPLLGLLCWLANTVVLGRPCTSSRARTAGRSSTTGWAARLHAARGACASLEKAYARHGVLGIFLSRFLPGVRAAVTPFAGVVGHVAR